jgi:broad specificity phosphatase PhoE
MPFDAFYSSDLGRAVSTADVIAAATGRTYELVPALRERAMGCFEGLTWPEIQAKYPDHHDAHRADRSVAVPCGESGHEFQTRIAQACNLLADRHPGQTILAVSHGHVLDIFLRYVLGIPTRQHRPARLPNASLNIFERHDGHWLMALGGTPRT